MAATPVAICGMGLRLPGRIKNDADMYKFLMEKRDARSIVPKSRYDIEKYYNEHSKKGTIISKYGYFLEDDLTHFDLSMISMTSVEASRLDPTQRVLLEVVRETFENSGEADFRGKNIGTFASMFAEDWRDLQTRDIEDGSPYQLTGMLDFMLGNRIAYEYDLKGPSFTVKAACSSSGLALHQALQTILQGEISAAIVAGANLLFAPGLSITMSATGTLSSSGSCKSFDASADGYGRAEGIACLYVKRLDEAIRDGNPVRAVIRASASNADGKTAALTVPNPVAHESFIRQAYENAGLSFRDTAMVECHGSGTFVGDSLEVSAVANCFGADGVYIGSAKPNLVQSNLLLSDFKTLKILKGHSEGASAITSIIKAVVSLENTTILPNIKFTTPSPKIPWKTGKLQVPTEPLPWPEDRRERISVNSFGIGGSNVHFVLDSAKSFGISTPKGCNDDPKQANKSLLLFSANNAGSLQALLDAYRKYLDRFPHELESLKFTLSERREHLKLRGYHLMHGSSSFKVVHNTKETKLAADNILFVFTGQGAQWVHMGRELLLRYEIFSGSIRMMDAALSSLHDAPSWTIENIILKCEDEMILTTPGFSQPGVTPAAIVGHSSGEIAGSYASGALSLREAIIVSFYRGHVCKGSAKSGGMAAVGLGRDDIQNYLVSGVQVACEHSSKNVTISGDVVSLDATLDTIKIAHPNVPARKLQVSMAYHSDHMRVVGGVYHDLIADHLNPQRPRLPFFSSVHGRLLSEAQEFTAKYWKDNLENPVLFSTAVNVALRNCPNAHIHLEVGPHSALAGSMKQIFLEQGTSNAYSSVLKRKTDDVDTFLETMGQLYLAGSRILESSEVEPSWRNILRLIDVPWLRDHRVSSDIVFLAAGYVAMAGAAAAQLRDDGESTQLDYTIQEMCIQNTLVLRDDTPSEIITTLRPRALTTELDSNWYEFSILLYDGSSWSRHCRGLVAAGQARKFIPTETLSFARGVCADRWYKTMARIGLNYGPRFTGLRDITAGVSNRGCSGTVTNTKEKWESPYATHPATLDVIFQSFIVAWTKGIYRELTQLSLPTFIEEIYVGETKSAAIHFNTTATETQGSSHGVVDDDIVLFMRGLKLTPLRGGNNDDLLEPFAQCLQWKPDFYFAETNKILKPKMDIRPQLALTERLFVLCAAEAEHSLSSLIPSQPHLVSFVAWLEGQIKRFDSPDYPLVEDSQLLLHLDSATRLYRITDCLAEIQQTDVRKLGNAIWKTFSHLADIIEGRIDFLELLFQDHVLQDLYEWMDILVDLSDFLSLLGNSQPQMKILEIGAGTGGLTAKVINSLKNEYGERLYHSYTFTDISSGFFAKAKERFKEHHSIEYKVLDISKDPIAQGFAPGEYDFILAANVLHATPTLSETLANCRKLLKPSGKLFLQELSPEEWEVKLRGADFEIISVTLDGVRPYYVNANIIARPTIVIDNVKRITLLTNFQSLGPSAEAVKNELESQGYTINHCIWGEEEIPTSQDLISFVDIEDRKDPLFRDINDEDLKYLLKLVDALSHPIIL
ncbi:Thiolase-like protein [Glarea lozoyensis ATCC 20868]|uniref:Thiolase-like protein n=1 Tax=Glarea lozoyensis (strain ATCC 20868 / MF5171) TaxID=1116229 RepID=S3D9P2_GLAL2|nr:Thiolase-like protein [Glarea lozoyensis ATCC 20868]EPE28701.1 Thiolase-like protein [Glarea lozoyensis ATCC 20868]